jgi:hypothetical protein
MKFGRQDVSKGKDPVKTRGVSSFAGTNSWSVEVEIQFT